MKTAKEILLKHLNDGASERRIKFNENVNWDLFIAAMEEYAHKAIKENDIIILQSKEAHKSCIRENMKLRGLLNELKDFILRETHGPNYIESRKQAIEKIDAFITSQHK